MLLFASLSLGVLLLPATASAVVERTTVCLQGGNGSFHSVEVPNQAVPGLLIHGSGLLGDAVPGMSGYVFGEGCVPEQAAAVLAIAYSNLDGNAGYSASSGDVLIAELVDTNGDEEPSVGDTVIMGQYPTDFDASSFGTFQVTEHEVIGFRYTTTSTSVTPVIATGKWLQFYDIGTLENYYENNNGDTTVLQDAIGFSNDKISVSTTSPSEPDTVVPITERTGDQTDDGFIDVDITL